MVLGEKAVIDLTKGKEVIASGSITNNVEAKINSSPIVDGEREKNSPPIPCEAKKFCVLIVDDQSFNRIVHRSMVTSLGLDAELAENGKIAVDLHRAGASFDLILMDRDMPVMNGAEATKELRAMGVETKIVGVTAHENSTALQEFIEAGLNEIFAKPITLPQIAAMVELVKKDQKKKAEKSANDDV